MQWLRWLGNPCIGLTFLLDNLGCGRSNHPFFIFKSQFIKYPFCPRLSNLGQPVYCRSPDQNPLQPEHGPGSQQAADGVSGYIVNICIAPGNKVLMHFVQYSVQHDHGCNPPELPCLVAPV